VHSGAAGAASQPGRSTMLQIIAAAAAVLLPGGNAWIIRLYLKLVH
jgi:hypothetical protein